MTDATCTSCGGTLVSRKRYRMGPVVVAVGSFGLLVSGLGICGSLVMIFVGIDRITEMFVREMAVPRIEVLRVAGVPPEVIARVTDEEALTAAEREDLTDRQLRLIGELRLHIEATREASVTAAATARFNAIVIAGFCAITGLLSLLMITKRTDLRCETCQPHD
jgi:hypothetical protein